MHASTSRPFQSSDPRDRPSDQTVSSVQLPLQSPPSDFEEAVQKLKHRPVDELRQARKHHRRALKALREGGYDALPDETREQLIARFHTALEALNKALETESSEGNASSQETTSLGALLNDALPWPW